MTTMTTPTRLLRLPQVIDITGLGRDSVYRLARDGAFPQPLKVTAHSSRWREDQVLAWVESRPVKSSPTTAAAA